jgi:hypothetical protein
VIAACLTVTLDPMRRDLDDDPARRPGAAGRAAGSGLRTAGLTVGFLLAVAATVVVFVTDNPQVLRLAVVGAAWAFVLAALATARRAAAPGDGTAVRDAAVRDATDRDALERAAAERTAVERVAAEREADLRLAYELELEREVAARREFELRLDSDLRRAAEESMRTQLDELRGELARVAGLRGELARISELREDVAEVAGLRGELAQVSELRRDIAQLAELRADVGRLRAELAEQLSGEMLIERIMLRTQSVRTGPSTAETPVTRTIDAVGWSEPVPELPAPMPPIGTDDLLGGSPTRQFDEVRVRPAEPAAPPPPPPAGTHRRRRSDDGPPAPAPDELLTVQRPVAQRERPPVPGSAEPAEPDEGSTRLAQILAEGGGVPPSGGRRRRRYRDEDDGNDVLSRVLGR